MPIDTIVNDSGRVVVIKTLLDGYVNVPIGESVKFEMKGDKFLRKTLSKNNVL